MKHKYIQFFSAVLALLLSTQMIRAQVPVINSFSPSSGPVGTTVTLTGDNFSPIASSNIVWFGAVAAPVTSAQSTQLVVNVPAFASQAPITVTVGGLICAAPAPFIVTYVGTTFSSSSLTPATNLPGGLAPSWIENADFDGDGKPDLAVANFTDGTISIYRNISTNGTLTVGSFAPRITFSVGPNPRRIAVGDIDGDGKPDVVASDSGAASVSIFRNVSTPGTFTTNSFEPRVQFPTGNAPNHVMLADMNADGKLDLVVANHADDTISIFRNIASPGSITTNSFTNRVDFATVASPHGLAIADLDGDGKPDVSVSSDGISGISILRNMTPAGSATITLAGKVDFSTPARPYGGLSIGDLDGDGKPDIAVSVFDGSTISVFKNVSSAGTFTSGSLSAGFSLAAGGKPIAVLIADIDGDGKSDLCVTTGNTANKVAVFQNISTNGSLVPGSFAPRIDFAAAANPHSLSVGDLDGDGRPDVVAAANYGDVLSLYRNISSPFPAITTQPQSQTVVTGAIVTFSVVASGSQPLIYQWQFNGTNISSATTSSLILSNVQPIDAGNYSVVITNLAGLVTSSNAVLTVINAGPAIFENFEPGIHSIQWSAFSSTVLATNYGGFVSATHSLWFGGSGSRFATTRAIDVSGGASISFYLHLASGGAPGIWETVDLPGEGVVFEYSLNGSSWTNIGTYNTSTYFNWTLVQPALPVGAQTSGTLFRWRQLANSGSPSDHWALDDIQILPASSAPSIATQPLSQFAAVGTNLTLNVVAFGQSPLTYQWLLNSSNVLSSTNASLTLTNLQLSDSGDYSVLVANSIGSVTSVTAVVTVLTPPSISSQPQSQGVVQGTNVSFSVTSSGSAPLSYQWRLNGVAIAQATNSTLVLTNVQGSNGGIYSVRVTNAVGSVVSSNATLSIDTFPSIVAQPQSQTVAAGTNVTFSVGLDSALPATSSGTLRLWLKADAGTITNAGGKISQWQDQSGQTNHCSQIDTNIQPTLVSASAIGGRSTVRFNGSVDTSTGSYLKGTGDVGIPDAYTSFLVYSMSYAGSGERMPVFVGVPGTYGAGRSYYVLNGEMSFASWAYDFYSGFIIPTNTYRIWTDRMNTNRTSMEFFDTTSATSTNINRTINGQQTPAAGYYVGGFNALETAGRNYAGDIAELIYFRGSLSETDRAAVENYLKQKYFQSGSSGSVTFQWQFNGTNVLGATNASLTLSNVQPVDAGNYSVIVANAAGSTTSSNALLTVSIPPSITTQPQSQGVVQGTNVSFSVTASGSAPLSYQWRLNGVAIAQGTNSTLVLTNVQSSNAGNYSVLVTNAVGSVISSNATLTIDTFPSIVSQPQSQSVIAGTNVTFSVELDAALPSVSSGTLKLWLKADAGVITTSNRVTQWQDQSSNTNHAFQADPNKQPLLVSGAVPISGKPVVRFDGLLSASNGDFLQGSGDVDIPAGFTSFLVCSEKDLIIDGHIPVFIGVPGQSSAVRTYYIFSASPNTMGFAAWLNDYDSGLSVPADTFHSWTFRLNSSKTQIEYFDTDGLTNRTSSSATSGLTTPGAGYFIGGAGSAFSTYHFKGDIAEVIYYQGTLTESDRLAVDNYLKQKYFQSGTVGSATFQWQFNGTNILGATNVSLTLSNVQPVDAGNYSVIVANAAGSTTSSNALLTVNVPPSVTTQPQSQSLNAGSAATFNVVAAGTAPLSYQWQKDLGALPGATNSSLGLSALQPSDSGNYRVIVSSPFGTVTSSNAALSVNVSTVRVVSTNATSASSFTLPIDLSALGNENAIGFTLAFDPSILSFSAVALDSGLSGAILISNTDQLGSGKLGLAVALSANNAFAPGNQRIMNVTFNVAVTTNALNTTINFGDIPTTRQISDVNAATLSSSFVGGAVAVAAVDFEGDVAPRPGGSRTLTVVDWVQVGRFAAALDIPSADEFQRADCAPRSTLGNGTISITDWVQAGRYAAGADPLTPVGGPTAPDLLARKSVRKLGPTPADLNRIVSLETTNQDTQTHTHTVSARLVAQGNENAIGFSLSFDPQSLTFNGVTVGGSAPNALLNVNTNSVGLGRVGVALSLGSGSSFPAGTQEVIKLTFVAAPAATGVTPLTFSDLPILREVSDATANSLQAAYNGASLVLGVPGPLLTIAKSAGGILLSWPASATNFVLESSSNIGTNWTTVATGLTTNGPSVSATLPVGEQAQFFRLKQ